MRILRDVLGAIITTIIVFFSMSVCAMADEYESGDYKYEINPDGNTATITQYMAENEIVEIPAYIDNYKVTIIGEGAFFGKLITKVSVPDTVEKISSSAFRSCSMEDIQLPDSLKIIEDNAFEQCVYLKKIYIPSGVEEIRSEAFYHCESLNEIYISSGVKEIGSYAFCGCGNINSIVVDEANTYFDSREECNALIETSSNSILRGCINTVIPKSVTCIGVCAFDHCNNLSSVEIPANIVKIDSEAFYNCPDLKKVVIPENVVEMGAGVFSHCEALTSVELSKNIKELPKELFFLCTSLEYIELPSGLISIGTRTFRECTGLKNIYIPQSVKYIGDGAFEGCSSLSFVKLPNNIETIDSCAFAACTNLKNITIPEHVKKLGMSAFAYSALTSVVIPSGIEILQSDIFSNCVDLKKIEILEGCSEISEGMFNGCISLMDVQLPDGIKYIGEKAFAECKNLSSILIPNSAIIIEPDVFSQHNNMFEIKCYDGSVAYKYAVNNSIKYTIIEAPLLDISQAEISGIKNKNYDGISQKQDSISVKLNDVQLLEGPDYILSYENNIYPGEAKVIISGIEKYCGSIEKTFLIIKQIVNIGTNSNISISNIPSSVTYSGSQITFPNLKVTISDTVLEEKKDYIVTYTGNINVGNMNIIITGIGDYTGSITRKVSIKQREISEKSSSVTVAGIPKTEVYTGKAHTYSKIVVRYNNAMLSLGKDYDVRYYNNRNVGIAKVVVLGKGNYTGSITKTFIIKIPVGKVYVSGGLKYKVMSFGSDGKGNVALIGSVDKKINKKFTVLNVKKYVNIGDAKMNVVAIGDNAFKGYIYLKKLIVGSNVKSIGKNAFYGCKSLSNVAIGENTRRIGDNCFSRCSNLRKMDIYSTYLTKTSVRKCAFKGIYSKALIKVPARCLKSYKSLMVLRGISKKAKITSR